MNSTTVLWRSWQTGLYAIKGRHIIIILPALSVLCGWVFTSGWNPVTFEVVMLKFLCLCILRSRSVTYHPLTSALRKSCQEHTFNIIWKFSKVHAVYNNDKRPPAFLIVSVPVGTFINCARRPCFRASARGIGYSFQLAITTPRMNLIGYGTATAQS